MEKYDLLVNRMCILSKWALDYDFHFDESTNEAIELFADITDHNNLKSESDIKQWVDITESLIESLDTDPDKAVYWITSMMWNTLKQLKSLESDPELKAVFVAMQTKMTPYLGKHNANLDLYEKMDKHITKHSVSSLDFSQEMSD